MTTMWLATAFMSVLISGIFLMRWLGRTIDRDMKAGTYANRFIYVNEDGSARALTPDERNYLNTKFYPSDGSRPYVKSRYDQTTPDGRISGFLLKKRLPRRIQVKE